MESIKTVRESPDVDELSDELQLRIKQQIPARANMLLAEFKLEFSEMIIRISHWFRP